MSETTEELLAHCLMRDWTCSRKQYRRGALPREKSILIITSDAN